MTSVTTKAVPTSTPSRLRSWQAGVGLIGVAAGAVIAAGAFLPWVTEFGGLIPIAGVRGDNGRLLAAAGILIAAAGIYHVIRGGTVSRWLIGIGGAAALAFSGDLLFRLSASIRSLSGSAGMLAARGGPGLWAVAAGSLIAFSTLFLPSSAQATLRRRDAGGGLAAWAADRDSRGARRWLQIGLGLVWLLDAALQYQPYMFGRGFATQIISPTAMGNPALVANPVMATAQAIAEHPVAWNAAFATVQLALAVGLLWRPTVRAALAGSIAWALGVWWLGEGMGGIFAGSASPLTGAPGAALIYALIAALAWPTGAGREHAATEHRATEHRAGEHRAGEHPAGERAISVADASPIGGRCARLAWLVLWGGLAYLAVLPVNRAAGALRATITANAVGEPGWLAALDRSAAGLTGSHGTMISVAMAVVFVLVGAGIFVSRTLRPALLVAIAAAMLIWVVGENFGGILTGTGTDPDTGLLLVLLTAAFWPWTRIGRADGLAGGRPKVGQEAA